MKPFQGNRKLAKIERDRQRYEESIGDLEKYLRDKIEFDFSIDYQPSDGHMLLNIESGLRIAPVDECLSVIYRKGSMSIEDHKKLCI